MKNSKFLIAAIVCGIAVAVAPVSVKAAAATPTATAPAKKAKKHKKTKPPVVAVAPVPGDGFAPAPAEAPKPRYTGFYVGAHGGYGWGDSDWTFIDAGSTASHGINGAHIGGHVGYSYQFANNIVLGVEGAGSWVDWSGESVCPNPSARCRTKLYGVGDATVRAGYAFENVPYIGNILPYVRGGVTMAGAESFVSFPGAEAFNETSHHRNLFGYTAGGGFEYALCPKTSVAAGYDYRDYGTSKFDMVRANTHAFVERVREHDVEHSVYFAVNYKFSDYALGPVEMPW
ncbi:MAG: outer membrane beta-barrel protein [Alphaproteobacteria bacterium]